MQNLMIDEADEAMPGQQAKSAQKRQADTPPPSPRPNKRKPGMPFCRLCCVDSCVVNRPKVSVLCCLVNLSIIEQCIHAYVTGPLPRDVPMRQLLSPKHEVEYPPMSPSHTGQ